MSFIIRRIISTGIVIIGILISVFLLPRLTPGDPCLRQLGDHATDAQIAACHTRHNLNQPIHMQFINYVNQLWHGNLGISIHTEHPIGQELVRRSAATIELALAALVLALVLGIVPGVIAALHHNHTIDWVIRSITLIGTGLPTFLIGLLLKEIFSRHLAWFPRVGRLDDIVPPPTRLGMYTLDSLLAGDIETCLVSLTYLVLPACTLSLATAATLTRIVRVAMLEVLAQRYILAARARGLRDMIVLYRHAFTNALIPTLTIAGLATGNVLSGAVITEYIFSWPGLGRYAAEAAMQHDYPVVLAVALLASCVYPISHLGIELIQQRIDPRFVLNK